MAAPNTCDEIVETLKARAACVPGLEPWLVSFLLEAAQETLILQRNGALQAAQARMCLSERLIEAAEHWLHAEIDVEEAAKELGKAEETIRRKVRNGNLPDRRTKPGGRIRLRRGEVLALESKSREPYDPLTDAQDIATLRRLR